MTATTPLYGLTYPTDADPVTNYPEIVQQLAEDVEAQLDTASVARLGRSSAQTIADSTPTPISWGTGASFLGDDFDLTVTTVLKYTGPPRYFVWRYGIGWDGGSGLHRAIFRSQTGGTPGFENFVYRQLTGPSAAQPVNDSGLVFMDTDSEWQLEVYQESGSAEDAAAYMTLKGI